MDLDERFIDDEQVETISDLFHAKYFLYLLSKSQTLSH